jgi:hypothetical protein
MASQCSASSGLTIFSAPFSVARTIRRSSCSRAAQLGVAQCLGLPASFRLGMLISFQHACRGMAAVSFIPHLQGRTDRINYFTLVCRQSLVGISRSAWARRCTASALMAIASQLFGNTNTRPPICLQPRLRLQPRYQPDAGLVAARQLQD